MQTVLTSDPASCSLLFNLILLTFKYNYIESFNLCDSVPYFVLVLRCIIKLSKPIYICKLFLSPSNLFLKFEFLSKGRQLSLLDSKIPFVQFPKSVTDIYQNAIHMALIYVYTEAESDDLYSFLNNRKLPVCVGDGRDITNKLQKLKVLLVFLPNLVSLAFMIAEIYAFKRTDRQLLSI